MTPLTKAERAALAIIVNSGRAAVEAELLSTLDDAGAVTAHGRRDEGSGRFVGHFGLGGDEALAAQTADRLCDRGLVDLWSVGIVKGVNHDKKYKWVRPSTLATLSPLAAELLGVKLSIVGGVLRWTEAGRNADAAEIIDDPAQPYPSPLPELEKLPPEPRGRKRNRPASS